jgi:hypothetical protein
VKLDLDTLLTVPDDPPAAGPDRAFDPLPLAPPAAVLPDTGCAADAGADVASPMESPMTGAISAATAIRPTFLFENSRHTFCRRDRSVDGFDWFAEKAGGRASPAPVSLELPATEDAEFRVGARLGEKSLRGLVGS